MTRFEDLPYRPGIPAVAVNHEDGRALISAGDRVEDIWPVSARGAFY